MLIAVEQAVRLGFFSFAVKRNSRDGVVMEFEELGSATDTPREAEIAEPKDTVLRNENVRRLYVSVHNPHRVECRQAAQKLKHEVLDLSFSKRPSSRASNQYTKLMARLLHYERPVLGIAVRHGEYLDDVCVLQA